VHPRGNKQDTGNKDDTVVEAEKSKREQFCIRMKRRRENTKDDNGDDDDDDKRERSTLLTTILS